MSRQTERAAAKAEQKAREAHLKSLNKPVTVAEFRDAMNQMMAQVAIMDTFLYEKFGEEFKDHIEDYIKKLKDKREEISTPSEEESTTEDE